MLQSMYFDLQVNGYGGVDFNQSNLAAPDLHRACEKLLADGVAGILATIITEHLDEMCRRIARLVELRQKDELARKIIAGLHIEGPFLSPTEGYRGAHPADVIMPADVVAAGRLIDAGAGLVKLITLAPEMDEQFRVTRMLSDRGVVVSAGHTDASTDQLRGAIDAGLSMFTHLGNGCPMKLHRHDNIIQRALWFHRELWLCFIADGVHVPPAALSNYLRAAGSDRCIVVTDAIAPAGLGPGRYTLGRWDLQIGEDMVARAPDGSHFVGSAGTMNNSVGVLRDKLQLRDAVCRQLTFDNPRRAMGIN
jgi:N-acetylglucosamine-6-phosphate deacetylase